MDRSVYLRMAEQDSEHWWFVARRQILADQIARLGLPRGARILEVGCGPGGNLQMLAGFGALDAMELDAGAREMARARAGIEVQPGALPDRLGFPPESFDLVVAFDVVEHVEPDAESVQAMAGLLRPGGALMITVPAYRWLWSEHDERHHHMRRYTGGEVRKLAEDAGLRVQKLSHFNTLLMPLIILVRFLKKLAGRTGSPDDATPSPLVNGLLRRVFACERFLLRHVSMPFGVSILCIARRG